MNFDELNCYYELFLSQISKYDITTHAQTWLRDNKKHIIGPRINLSENVYDMCAAQWRHRLYTNKRCTQWLALRRYVQ